MPSLLALPFELLLKIAVSLLHAGDALTEQNLDDPSAAMAGIERANSALDDLQSFSITCRTLKYVCSKIFRYVRLAGGERQAGFLRNLDEVQSGIYERNTRYLSLERPAACDTCGIHSCRNYTHACVTTMALLSKFPSTTTLDLANHHITFDTINALLPFKSLKTLYIRDPAPVWGIPVGILNIRRTWPLPQLDNIVISISDFESCHSPRTAIWCFEPKIKTLSIEGTKQSTFGAKDFLRETKGIYMGFGTRQYRNLRRVSIGYLEFRTRSLRNLIQNISGLETISVNCRGVPGLVPLFYIIDMLREHTGDEEGWFDMTDYDDLRNNQPDDPENPPPEPYIQDARIWRRSVAHFSCTFGISGQIPRADKWIKCLELAFASADVDSNPLNEDMRIDELVEVFERRQATFTRLENLSIHMSKDREFESREENIGETMTLMIDASLPSLQSCVVEWGNVVFRFAQ